MTESAVRLTLGEQMAAQTVLGYLRSLLFASERETFMRADVLDLVEAVKTDPLWFDAGVAAKFDAVEEQANATIQVQVNAAGEAVLNSILLAMAREANEPDEPKEPPCIS
jgi:hypothetical protein